jgi:hypothetical protein
LITSLELKARSNPVRSIFLILCLALLFGCSMPGANVPTLDDRPGISIHGAHRRAFVYVNGISMGRAGQYDDLGKILLLEPGTHYVEIVRKGTIIFTQRVFLGQGPQRIYVQ